MKRGYRKKGQFYILAAIIIITVLIGAVSLRNYITPRKESTKIYDLKEELKIETGSVYDYGIYNLQETNNLIESWAGNYSEYSKGQAVEDWLFVYGNINRLSAVTFSSVPTGEIGFETSVPINIELKKEEVEITDIGGATEGAFNVTFENFTQKFELEPGENFFCVVRAGEYTAIS